MFPKRRPTQRAPDGWDSPRFWELFLNLGRFPFSSFVLAQPPVTQAVGRSLLMGVGFAKRRVLSYIGYCRTRNAMEVAMNFFKKLFSKDEPFVATPTQEVPGLEPLVVQVAEIIFPKPEDQQVVFKNLLAAKKDYANDLVTIQLNILFFSDGRMNQFSKTVIDIKEFDPHRDIWPFKRIKEWAINVIKAGKFTTEPIYRTIS